MNRALQNGTWMLLLLAACRGALAFPHPVQEHYRWRRDDGSEASATWIVPTDIPHRKLVAEEQVRLRFTISNNKGTADATDYRLKLEYAAGTVESDYFPVPGTGGNEAFVMVESSHITNGESTSNLLPGDGEQFMSGVCVESPENRTVPASIFMKRYSNYEYCLKATTNAVGGQSYFFRLTEDGTPFDELEEPGEYEKTAEAFVVGLPVVDNADGAKAIATQSARLEGKVVQAKGDDPYVFVYWGPTDGGTDAVAWSNVVELGVRSREFSTVANSLWGNETVYYRCAASNVAGVSWADTTTNFTTLGPNVTFTNGDYSVDESATSITINVKLDVPSAEDVSVGYSTADGSARAGSDYVAVTGILQWAAGATGVRSLQVPLTNDDSDEPGEYFCVRLMDATNCTIADGEAAVVIEDDDGLPTLQFTDATSSGHESVSEAIVGLSLSPLTGKEVSIAFRVANGTATFGEDYTLTAGSVTIPAYQPGTNIVVTILEDSEYEGDETLMLEVYAPSNALLGVATSHVYTIVDSDPRPPTMGNWKGAAGISADGAILRGEVVDTGRDDPLVSVYWGPVDGGTNIAAWSNSIHFGVMGQTAFASNISVSTTGVLYYYRCRGVNVAGTGWSAASENFLAVDPPSFLLLDNPSFEGGDGESHVARSWARDGRDPDMRRVDEFARSGSYSARFPSSKGVFTYGTDLNSFLATWNGRYLDEQVHPGGGVRPGFVLRGTAHIRAREIGMDPSQFTFAWHNFYETSNWMSNHVVCTGVLYEDIPIANTNPIPPTVAGDLFVPVLQRDTVGSTHLDHFYADDVTVEVSLPRLNLQRDPSVPVFFQETVVGASTQESFGIRNLGGGTNTVLYGAYITEEQQLYDPAWDFTAWRELSDPGDCFNIVSGATLVATNNAGYQYTTIAFEPSVPGTFTGVFDIATTDPNDYYEGGAKLHGSLVYERYYVVGTAVAPPLITCSDVDIREGDNGSTRAVFTLSLATQIHASASVTFTATNGTATAGEDYTHMFGSAVFPAGETTCEIYADILGDLKREYTEVFYVVLSDPSNVTLPDPPQGKCEIRDDDSTLIIIR